MANIIFGVQGEGMGHALRCYTLIKHLKKKHNVKIFTGDRAYKYLSKKLEDVNEIESQNMVYRNNRIAILPTILLNIKKAGKVRESYRKIKKAIKDFKTDVIISDYEPITNFAANFSKCRHININNQNDITFWKAKPSLKEFFSFLNTRIITLAFTWGADYYMTYSIRDVPDRKKRIRLGTLVQEKIMQRKCSYSNHIFVYQTSSSYGKLIDILKSIDEKFIVYGFNKDKKEKNITFRKFNESIFFEDFCRCRAMIANGGLTTLSEAIHMKKPILSVPVKGQFEQTFNAKTIEKMGFGMRLEKASEEKIKEFLANLKTYKKNLDSYKGMSNKKIITRIERLLD